MSTVIKVKNLRKQFKTPIKKNWLKNIVKPEHKLTEVVKGISFTIKKGEAVAFLGPNGAGKTTTTKMMTGLIYPSSGEVEVLGYKPQDRKKDFLMRIGLVMGNKAGLNWDLTARQTFNLYKKIYKINDTDFTQRVDRLTDLLEVKDHMDKPVRKLSLGERMKLELIGAILHNPEILFLDEPTIGLDIIAKQNIRKFLRQIQKESEITLILTSHDMDDIETVCDRVIVINKGELVYDDNIQTLKNKYNKERYVKFIFDDNEKFNSKEILLSNQNEKNWPNVKDIEIFEEKSNEITFRVIPSIMPKLIGDVTAKYTLQDIEINSVPLEEMIKEIFESKGKNN